MRFKNITLRLEIFLFLFVSFRLLSFPTSAAVIYVDQDALGTEDGTRWEDAFTSITAGLTASASGDDIWVKNSTYNEAISMKEGLALYGGFAGTETFRDQRDCFANPTIIDATGLGTRVVTIDGVEGTTIDGFTITGGDANYENGGGVYFESINSAIISHCTISNNSTYYYGGGAYFQSSSPTIIQCSFTNNSAGNCGGGMFCEENSSPTLTSCKIVDNSAFYGGGIYSADNSSPKLTNCTITHNAVEYGGGGVCCRNSLPILTNCTITSNWADESGAGMLCSSASPTLTNCILWNPGDEIFIEYDSFPIVQYSCVQGGYSGTGNINVDPLFVDIAGSDYRLQDGSPCIDAGIDEGLDFNGSAPDLGSWESPSLYTQGPPREPVVHYVNASAPEGGDGRSWETAFQKVSSALSWWSAVGDEVWVAEGTYHESLIIRSGNASLFGGFTGTEIARDQRDWISHPTIIDAAGLGTRVVTVDRVNGTIIDGFTITGGNATGSYPDKYGGGLYYNSVDSATLANCRIKSNSAYYGGGVYCDSSSPTLIHCSINGNWAEYYGGGMNCYLSSPKLNQCTITGNNLTNYGGRGIYCDYSSPTLINCILWNPGDEIYGYDSHPTVSYCCIQGGYSGTGNINADPLLVKSSRGDYYLQDDSPCIDAGTDQGLAFNGSAPDMGSWESPAYYTQGPPREPMIQYVNASAPAGGDGRSWATAFQEISSALSFWSAAPGDEIWVAGGTYHESLTIQVDNATLLGGFTGTETNRDQRDWNANPTIIDATGMGVGAITIDGVEGTTVDGFTITGGIASSPSGQGGGLYYSHVDSATLSHCTITGNSAHYGGGIYSRLSSLKLTHCIISDNSADYDGGGLFCSYFSSMLTNCLITGNSAGYDGGGLYCSNASPHLINCTIADNSASGDSSGVHCRPNSLATLTNCILFNEGGDLGERYKSFSVSYSCVQGGWTGEGNISGRPLFVDPENGNYRLQNGSPCIDQGLVSGAPGDDIEGNARPGTDGLVDIGAYESPDEYEPEETEPWVFHIRSDASMGGDGLTWDTAMNSIREALSLASSSDEIWVASGTYQETIYLESRVSIYGGFLGSETNREERDWTANPTILQASGSSKTVRAFFIRGAVLDGFRITGDTTDYSGGVYCEGSSMTLNNCIIIDNSDSGIHCFNAIPNLNNCTIIGNSARGVYCESCSSATLIDCTITGNSGGGVYCDGFSPILVNCAITGNAANQGGGMYCIYSSPTIRDCRITGNSATEGGGVYCHYSNPILVNCVITGNSAASAGAVYCSNNSSPMLTNCTITDNLVTANGGGVICDESSSTLTNCILFNEGNELMGYESTFSVTYCCVQGGWTGEGNIGGHPLFVDPANGDYRLQNGSPGIDQGLISVTPDDDIEGNPRPGGDGFVDIGAYESPDEFEPRESEPMVFHIRANALAGGDGLTWDTALDSIQTALLLVSVSDEIWVAGGTYYETIQLESGVSIYGGFQGFETNREERDWIANPTIIDATRKGSAVSSMNNTSVILDGFTITGGSNFGGGGVYCYDSFITLNHCTIIGNSASFYGGCRVLLLFLPQTDQLYPFGQFIRLFRWWNQLLP